MPEVRVDRLRLAELRLPASHPKGPGIDVVYGYLVRDRDHCVLVDTGVGFGSDVIDRIYAPERFDLAEALGYLDVSPDEVTAVVNSHLHFDHCGGNDLFRGVPIFVQQAELDAAREPHYTVPGWVDFAGASYAPLRGVHSISDHLTLVPTPGHTPGHQSLVIRADGGVEIVVGQAAYSAGEFAFFFERSRGAPDAEASRHLASNASWSEAAYLESLATLAQLGPDRAYLSHDAVSWKREH